MNPASPETTKRRQFVKNVILGAPGVMMFPPLLTSCSQTSHQDPYPSFIPEGSFGFTEGVASFDPTPGSVILWTRYTPAKNEVELPSIIVEVATDLSFKQLIVSDTIVAEPENDNTIHIEIQNLKPYSTYYYRFASKLTGAVSPNGTTKTLPAGHEISTISIAFTSCANYELGHFNAYEAIRKSEVDLVVHLGDYIYEGFRENYFQQRKHSPEYELKTLEDYRTRYRQYRGDFYLQKLHQSKPFICVWDDHEFTNNAFKNGSPKYQKNDSEFLRRKEAAIQAWHEYLPCKTNDKNSIFRSFDLGNIAQLVVLDTRLIGRDKQLDYKDYLVGNQLKEQFYKDWKNTERSILGEIQKKWMVDKIKSSSAKWQIIGSQVLMGKHQLPAELIPLIDQAQKSGQISEEKKNEYIRHIVQLIELKSRAMQGDPTLTAEQISRIEDVLPYNLDSWDGYPAEREEIYTGVAGKNILTFSGASHNAWHNELRNDRGEFIGHEFGAPSVTSAGLEGIFGNDSIIVSAVEQTNVTLMDDVKYSKLSKRGFVKATFTPEAVQVEWIFVDNIGSENFDTFTDHVFRTD